MNIFSSLISAAQEAGDALICERIGSPKYEMGIRLLAALAPFLEKEPVPEIVESTGQK